MQINNIIHMARGLCPHTFKPDPMPFTITEDIKINSHPHCRGVCTICGYVAMVSYYWSREEGEECTPHEDALLTPVYTADPAAWLEATKDLSKQDWWYRFTNRLYLGNRMSMDAVLLIMLDYAQGSHALAEYIKSICRCHCTEKIKIDGVVVAVEKAKCPIHKKEVV